MQKKRGELTARQAKDVVRSYPAHQGQSTGSSEIVGFIPDQKEAVAFLQWLSSPEAREIGSKLRAKKGR